MTLVRCCRRFCDAESFATIEAELERKGMRLRAGGLEGWCAMHGQNMRSTHKPSLFVLKININLA